MSGIHTLSIFLVLNHLPIAPGCRVAFDDRDCPSELPAPFANDVGKPIEPRALLSRPARGEPWRIVIPFHGART